MEDLYSLLILEETNENLANLLMNKAKSIDDKDLIECGNLY